MAAVLNLNVGIAMAADNTGEQHAEPTVTNAPENQSTSPEETTHANPSQSNASKAQTEPATTQQEPDCN